MSKILTIALLCFSVLSIVVLFALTSFVKDYREYSSLNRTNINFEDGQILETSQYQKLIQLASYPLVGQFYSERLVKEMVMKKQWESVLEVCTKAVGSIFHKRSYRLWYYRAVAQCATFKIQACRKSLYEAEILAPIQFNDQVSSLLEIFNFRHKSRIQAMRKYKKQGKSFLTTSQRLHSVNYAVFS